MFVRKQVPQEAILQLTLLSFHSGTSAIYIYMGKALDHSSRVE
jgi:hypothetical protein